MTEGTVTSRWGANLPESMTLAADQTSESRLGTGGGLLSGIVRPGTSFPMQLNGRTGRSQSSRRPYSGAVDLRNVRSATGRGTNRNPLLIVTFTHWLQRQRVRKGTWR
jgi:hypothetical protein